MSVTVLVAVLVAVLRRLLCIAVLSSAAEHENTSSVETMTYGISMRLYATPCKGQKSDS